MEQLIDLTRLDSHDSFFLGDETFVYHIDSDLYCGRSSSLAVSCLEHEELASFNSELTVLHVFVVVLQYIGDSHEVTVYFRERLCHLCDRLRCSDAGYNVFALCVDQEFTEDRFLAVYRGSCEGYACTRRVTHVSEYHGLYVYSCTDVIRNLIELSVEDRSFCIP